MNDSVERSHHLLSKLNVYPAFAAEWNRDFEVRPVFYSVNNTRRHFLSRYSKTTYTQNNKTAGESGDYLTLSVNILTSKGKNILYEF